jgi:hypothetical protein
LDRDDLVPAKKIPRIEQALQTNINCVGDYIYTSPCTFPRTITVRLRDSHYTLVCDKDQKIINGISHKLQTLVLCWVDGDTVNYYDGTEERSENKRQFDEIKKDLFGDYAYL